MPEIVDHVAYLSQEIGPRPAGTEEEQQAALYITEQMQKEAGLSAVIEDFNGSPDADIPRMICCGCSLVVTVAALFVPVLGIASVVVTLIAALLFAAEAFDRPVLSKVLARGVSQNVVAKYDPGYSAEAGGSRRRKVVLVARYDSGKVRAELNGPLTQALPAIQWTTFGAMALLPVVLLLRNVVFLNDGGMVSTVLNVIVVILLVLACIPLATGALHKFAAYNEGANSNAAGTAVLLEVARRVGRGRVSEAELAERGEAAIHGEDAARAAGLVPEGVELVYEAENLKPPAMAPQTPEARLAAAKAAVAALTGKPVAGAAAADIAQNLVQIKEPPLSRPSDDDYHEVRGEVLEAFSTIPPDTMQEALAKAEAAAQDAEGIVAASDAALNVVSSVEPTPYSTALTGGVPDWFTKAQEKAKKPRTVEKPVQRSRYASALDAAVSESAGHFTEANMAVERRFEQQMDASRDGIREIKAPQWNVSTDHAEVPDSALKDGEAVDNAVSAAEHGAENVHSSDSFDGSATSASQNSENDPLSTTAMAPIDVSGLRPGDLPSMPELSMPSFLDPRKVQEEALATRQDEHRTDNRVNVTDGVSEEEEAVFGLVQDTSLDEAARKPIVLPDIGVSAANPAPITELPKQRAPLADVESAGKTAAKSLLTMLPSINLGSSDGNDGFDSTSAEGSPSEKAASLRAMLPSLSGAIARANASDAKSSNVNAAGSFAPAGATGAFAPVGDELLDNVDPDDIYVDDADDSAYDANFTETGAFAGPGYVEMPKSRVRRLFDRFRRKDKEEAPSAREWLNVDDTFDARTVGAERGGWESFREEDESAGDIDPSATTRMDAYEGDYLDESFDAFDENAFVGQDDRFESEGFHDEDLDVEDDEFDDYRGNASRPWNGGAFSARRVENADFDSESLAEESAQAAASEIEISDELQQIYQFRNPDINTEVWFVSLGSELAQNSGMKAFLAEHQQDLRGAIIIDLEALGAGDLSMIEQEGQFKTVKTSSRMKRYVKKASQATGVSVSSGRILWQDSAASFAIKHGHQAMHLVGMAGSKPAYFAQSDDVLENIDEETLSSNADFVMELLKNI